MERANGLPWEPRPRAASPWTDDRIVHLKTRWLQGVSTPAICRELGLSRNSVLGKIRRLSVVELSLSGLRGKRPLAAENRHPSGRGPADHPAVTPLCKQHQRPAWVILANPHVDDPRVDADISFSQRCSLLELNCSTCRWPEGNPASCDFFFCGAEPVRGKPYCATHCARAYRPAEETAQRPPNARVRRAMLRFLGIDTYIKHGGETATESQRVGEGE
jgi:GcrA cell cycle regulator